MYALAMVTYIPLHNMKLFIEYGEFERSKLLERDGQWFKKADSYVEKRERLN